MSKVLEIEGLGFAYDGEPVLEEVGFSLAENTILGIIGPNGAGKTTLIKIITGLLPFQRGTVRVFGKPPGAAGELIGYVPQHSFSDPFFPITVLEVTLQGRFSGRRLLRRLTSQDADAARRALEQVGMGGSDCRRIGALSIGQRQRVLLARALAGEPRLLILDEPLSGIDISLEFEFYEMLRKLKERMAVILISHDVGVVSHYVDRIACLNRRLYYHDDKAEALKSLERVYGCPVDVIAHGVPHRVFQEHEHGTGV